MNQNIRQALVVARRDFLAIVMTPTFLLFLLAPLLMVAFGGLGGMGAAAVADGSSAKDRIIIIAPADGVAAYRAADKMMRDGMIEEVQPPALHFVMPSADVPAQAKRLMLDKDYDTRAILYGDPARPVIIKASDKTVSGPYLANLATQTLRSAALGDRADMAASPTFIVAKQEQDSRMGRNLLAFVAVITLFMLTLILASQSVGMMAEEKANKVIEILAAAAPLESVFFGKLLGMLGVAFLFIAFWAGIGAMALPQLIGAADPNIASALAVVAPAIGWPLFGLLCFVYFILAFLILGALFLGIGSQAATIREIQMLSLPITLVQMAMFGLATAAAAAPATMVARIAEIIPFSSPLAMAAHGVHDAAVWPHLVAILWQSAWVALVIWLSVRMFRAGVLKSGGGWWSKLTGRRKFRAEDLDEGVV